MDYGKNSISNDTFVLAEEEMVRRSDAVFVSEPRWGQSSGITREVKAALKEGVPVLFSLEDLERWKTDWVREKESE